MINTVYEYSTRRPGLIVIVFLLLAWPVYAVNDTDSTAVVITNPDSVNVPAPAVAVIKTKSPRGAMIRSLIVPGWGQFYNGKWFKGIVLCGLETGLVVDAIVQNQFAVRATDPLEKAFYEDNRSLAIWWLGASILYSITDAFVDAHLYHFDDTPDLSFKMKNEIEPLTNTKYAVISINLKIPLE